MVEVGARIMVGSPKVGVEARSGTVTATDGPRVQVRWDDGHETTFVPGPGSMNVVGKRKGSR